MKQAMMGFSLVVIALGAIVMILASNFDTDKRTMFEQAISTSMVKSLEDMCFLDPDLSYDEILNEYISNLAINLNGTNNIKVDVISIDRDYGIIDTVNELTYDDFFNVSKTITLRKTIIHNPEIDGDLYQVDFVVDDTFKGALFVNENTSIAEAINDFGLNANWNLEGRELNDAITSDMTIYAN